MSLEVYLLWSAVTAHAKKRRQIMLPMRVKTGFYSLCSIFTVLNNMSCCEEHHLWGESLNIKFLRTLLEINQVY